MQKYNKSTREMEEVIDIKSLKESIKHNSEHGKSSMRDDYKATAAPADPEVSSPAPDATTSDPL